MLSLFKPKDERNFLFLEKQITKRKEKNKKLTPLVEIPRIKKYIEEIIQKKTPYDYISCYNEDLINILDWYFKEQKYINENNEELFLWAKYQLKSEIAKNINSLSHMLNTWVFIFEEKPETKNKKNKDNERIRTKHNKYYLNDLLTLLDDQQLDTGILNSFFKWMINNVSKIKNSKTNYFKVLNKLINHPNFNKQLLVDFMYSQISKKDEKWYVSSMKGWDDIDLNVVKTYILNKKILKHHEVLGLATLPYISLWEILIKKYFLTQHLIIDFLDHIFQFKKPEEKPIILNFINTKMFFVYQNPQLKYKVQEYLKSE